MEFNIVRPRKPWKIKSMSDRLVIADVKARIINNIRLRQVMK